METQAAKAIEVRPGETLQRAIARHVANDELTIRDRATMKAKWGVDYWAFDNALIEDQSGTPRGTNGTGTVS